MQSTPPPRSLTPDCRIPSSLVPGLAQVRRIVVNTQGWPRFSDEQLEYARAVRAFCEREVGTREKLAVLTDNGGRIP